MLMLEYWHAVDPVTAIHARTQSGQFFGVRGDFSLKMEPLKVWEVQVTPSPEPEFQVYEIPEVAAPQ